jgi:hypothetical protein
VEGVMTILSKVGLATALATAIVIGSAGAQQPGAPQGQPGGPGYGYPGYGYMMGPWMMGYGHMGRWMMGWGGQDVPTCAAIVSHIEGRLAYLKTELRITAAQDTLWTAYANATRDNAQAMATRCTTMMGQGRVVTLSLLERLDLQERFMAAQLDAMRATNNALKPLYISFDDSQKRTADQLFWGEMGHIGMMGIM